MNRDNYGWPIYMPTDEFRRYDGVIDTGRYYIESTDGFALQGNGWYCDSAIDKALNYKLITSEDIKYQLKAHMSLNPNHFKPFVLEVYDKTECPKQTINGLIGLLGKPNIPKHQHYFESDYNVIADGLVNNDDDIHAKGIYKENNNTKFVNLVNSNENDLQDLIEEAQNNTIEPRLYKPPIDRQVSMYENTLSIHRGIHDIAKMEVYELHRKIKECNPECELVGVKTDCLIHSQPSTCTKWGGVKKCDVPIVHECTLTKDSRVRTDTYELTNNTWNSIQWDADNGCVNEEGFKMDQKLQTHIQQSCLCLGMAGTGKSKILQEMQRTLSNNEVSKPFVTACPTHKACKIINGATLYRLFDVNPIDYSYE